MSKPARILLCRPDRIGDVVLSTSCITPIRNQYPDAKLHFLIQPYVSSLLRGHPLLDSVETLPEASSNVAERLAQIEAIFSKLRIDTLIQLQPEGLVEEAAYHAGVQRRIGFESSFSKYLTETISYTKKLGLKHETQYGFELLSQIGVKEPSPSELSPSLHVCESARATALEKLGPQARANGYVAMHLSAFGEKPRLPVPIFTETAKWIMRETDLFIVLIGEERNDPASSAFMDAFSQRVINLYGETLIEESAWLLAGAKVFISRDTGPAHLAAAMGCPTVTCFVQPGPTMCSNRWKPLGEKCWIIEPKLSRRWFERYRRYERRHMEAIHAADIIEAVRDVLK